jgi:hypothetical protein
VLISGLISAKGAPRSLLWLWLDGSFELIMSVAARGTGAGSAAPKVSTLRNCT